MVFNGFVSGKVALVSYGIDVFGQIDGYIHKICCLQRVISIFYTPKKDVV